MEGILQMILFINPKTGLVHHKKLIHGPLKTLVWDTLSETSINNKDWFDAKAVTRLLNEDKENDASYSIFVTLY